MRASDSPKTSHPTPYKNLLRVLLWASITPPRTTDFDVTTAELAAALASTLTDPAERTATRNNLQPLSRSCCHCPHLLPLAAAFAHYLIAQLPQQTPLPTSRKLSSKCYRLVITSSHFKQGLQQKYELAMKEKAMAKLEKEKLAKKARPLEHRTLTRSHPIDERG